MTLPVPSFAALATGDQPLSLFDQNFNALGAASVIACTATGSNSVTLTPVPNYFTPASYTDSSPIFAWVQQATSTGSVTIGVVGPGGSVLGNLVAFKLNGAAPLGAGDLVAGQSYNAIINHTLNSGAGGFVVDVVGVGEAPLTGLTYGRVNGLWTPVLPIIGGTLSGPLYLAGDPALPLQAATKRYVDSAIGGGGGGGGGVPEAPLDSNLYGRMNATWQIVPGASALVPTMNGVAAVGSANAWSRGDHVHPTDTSRAPIINAALTGAPTAPTAANGNNSTAIATTAYVLATRLDQLQPPAVDVQWAARHITNLANPVNPQDAATKNYADATIQGLQIKPTARLATTAALPANTYNNGTAGVGATLTANANAALSVDGIPVATNDVVLVNNEVAATNNGLYTVTNPGSAAAAYVLTRSTSMNSASAFPGAFVPVGPSGSVNQNTLWLANPTTPVTVGTTAIPWTQINSQTGMLAGNGISISGTTINAVGQPNRITVGANIDIASNYVGQGSITTVGTLATGVWNATAVTVAYGGTGATTLTGYVKGNGTSPMTAVTTIPNTDISGLGTMATQNASAVAITGGTVNNVSLVSPIMTGTPTAPTAAVATNTTQVATTAFVLANGGAQPATTNPVMDGAAAIGVLANYARADHVHPSDTSRLAIAGGTLTGPLILAADPSAGLGAATKQYVDAHIGAMILRSYLAALTLSTAGSSTSFSVTPGVAVDSTNAVVMTLTSSISKTTGAWVVGSGNGALDTGTIANSTWYHVYLIERTDTLVVEVLISLSATTPTLPTNYTLFRRIGSMLTNASGNWTLFHQLGDEFLWDAPVLDVNTTTLSTTATLSALTVPTGVQVRAKIRGAGSNATAGKQILITSPDESTQVPNTPTGNLTGINPAAGVAEVFTIDVRTNTSAQIRYVASVASSSLWVATYGWHDRRGQDN
jgi:hypothetical protein